MKHTHIYNTIEIFDKKRQLSKVVHTTDHDVDINLLYGNCYQLKIINKQSGAIVADRECFLADETDKLFVLSDPEFYFVMKKTFIF